MPHPFEQLTFDPTPDTDLDHRRAIVQGDNEDRYGITTAPDDHTIVAATTRGQDA